MTETSARPADAATPPDAPTPEPAQAATVPEQTQAATTPDPAPPQATPDPAETLARADTDYRDKLLRALAEMENLRRRTQREVVDARQYAIAAFARDVLAVADNMGRALGAVGPELRQAADVNTKALLEGVELTERELLKVLERHGVRKFEPKGERFDPNLHQAMYEVSDPSLPIGTVAQVVQAGYMIGERMLRPALVAVAKGAPKRALAEEPANDNAGAAPPDPPAAG